MALPQEVPAVQIGSFQGTLERLESAIDVLGVLIDRVDHAANLVENRAVPIRGVDPPVPRAMLNLARIETDLNTQINRLRELVPILS